MKGRFEIDEIVTQDKGGVVFRALDRETGREVALRRLLPRGIDGNGLNRREAEEYLLAAEKLASVQDASLRAVVGWGVDPVDGMPWLATAWAGGESLASLMEQGNLSVEAGRMLVEQGLAVQVALDAQAPGWRLATDPDSVVVEMIEDDFRFTWWVEPFPGPEGRTRGVAVEIAQLVESALGWKGLALPAGAGEGLADWIRRVRAERLTAAGAIALLAGTASMTTGGQTELPLRSTPAGRPLPPSVTLPAKRSGRGHMKWIWLGLGAAVAGVVGVVVWLNFGGGKPVAPGDKTPTQAPTSQVNLANQRAREMAAAAASGKALGDVPVYGCDEVEKIKQLEGRRIAITGVLARVRDSDSGKSRYLEFGPEKSEAHVTGRCWAESSNGLGKEDLEKWTGKKIRIEGDVRLESGTGRVVIHFTEGNQVRQVE